MPQTASAKKALRRSLKRREYNLRRKRLYHQAKRAFLKNPTPKLLAKLYSAIDRCVKRRVFHPNKGARLKSKFAQKLKSSKAAKK